MAQYKAVPTPPVIRFVDDDDLEVKLQEYAEMITKESVGGWEFVGIFPFEAEQMEKQGSFVGGILKNKLAGRDAFDSKKGSFMTNMMLFKKE